MNMEDVIKIIIQIILFLGCSYLIFYKNWLKALGAEFAKLATIKNLTEIQENIKSEFNIKLEEQKIKLNEGLALKIETIKSELSKNNITHQIQFSYLHQERAKIIITLYHKLVELQSAMVDWTSFIHIVQEDAEKEAKERADRANKAFTEFRDFYLNNKLFFQRTFCETLDKVTEEYWSKSWDYGYKEGQIKSGIVSGDFYKNYYTEMSTIRDEVKKEIPKKIAEIEDKFREMLNVEI